VLDAYAPRTADRVWTLSAPSLLAATDAGRSLDDLNSSPFRATGIPRLPSLP
jgi:hypothetical protein